MAIKLKPLSSFPFITRVEFTTNQSLETCVERLSRQQTTRSWRKVFLPQSDLDFNFVPINSHQGEFTAYRRHARFEVKMSGYLQKLTDNSTLVTGTVSFSEAMLLFLLPFLAIATIAIGIGLIEFVSYGQCFMGIIGIFFIGIEGLCIATLRRYSIELARLIEESLK